MELCAKSFREEHNLVECDEYSQILRHCLMFMPSHSSLRIHHVCTPREAADPGHANQPRFPGNMRLGVREREFFSTWECNMLSKLGAMERRRRKAFSTRGPGREKPGCRENADEVKPQRKPRYGRVQVAFQFLILVLPETS